MDEGIGLTRQLFVEMVESAGGLGVSEHPKARDFINGSADIQFTEIEVDSLTRMQLAIDFEEKFQIQIGPDFLGAHETLGQLYQEISELVIMKND